MTCLLPTACRVRLDSIATTSTVESAHECQVHARRSSHAPLPRVMCLEKSTQANANSYQTDGLDLRHRATGDSANLGTVRAQGRAASVLSMSACPKPTACHLARLASMIALQSYALKQARCICLAPRRRGRVCASQQALPLGSQR